VIDFGAFLEATSRMLFIGDIAARELRSRLELGGAWVLANLEGPLLADSSRHRPADKAGPQVHNRSLPETDSRLVLSLANNHTMDFGASGLTETLSRLDGAGLSHFGAGESLSDARKPRILEIDDRRVGVLGCCEGQFGSAEIDVPGVAEVGPWVYQTVREIRNDVEIVILSIHAASEMSPWPSPALQTMLRSYVDAGADIVYGHHAHVPRGIERYGGGLILYGPGNAVTDPRAWEGHPNSVWSLAIDVDCEERPFSFVVRPVEITRIEEGGETTLLAIRGDRLSATQEAYLADCSGPLDDPLLLRALWQETSVRLYRQVYSKWLGLDPDDGKSAWRRFRKTLFKSADRRGPSQSQLLLWYHLFACSSHHEAIREALGVLSGEITDRRNDRSAALADRYFRV
jgi:hypothetical protein